jgi:hypothetical protein
MNRQPHIVIVDFADGRQVIECASKSEALRIGGEHRRAGRVAFVHELSFAQRFGLDPRQS